MAKPQKNQIFDLTIDNYSSEGDGIARLDGMAVFVKGALRGERCRVKLLKVGKTAAWGRVEQVVTPSPPGSSRTALTFQSAAAVRCGT